jgi:hypothetical protein
MIDMATKSIISNGFISLSKNLLANVGAILSQTATGASLLNSPRMWRPSSGLTP